MIGRMIAVAALVSFSFAVSACDSDSPTQYGGAGSPVDTTRVWVKHLDYEAYVADGAVETGIEVQWQLAFQSTTNRRLRILRYLLERDAAVLVDRRFSSPPVHTSGSVISGKEVWIPIDAPTPDGDYRFRAFYETGRQSVNAVGDTLWHHLGSGIADTSFNVTL